MSAPTPPEHLSSGDRLVWLDGYAAGRESAAKVAEAMADSWAADWRTERKASSHLEGKSDGADEVALAIRAWDKS